MSSERSYNLSLTALYIGVPVLVGASCYYLYVSRNKDDSKSSSNGKPNKKELSPLDQLKHLKQTGNQNFSRKNYEVAMENYSKAIELSQTLAEQVKPEDLAIYYQNRAACHEALGNLEKVVEDCTKAVNLKKTYTKAYLRRAKAYEKLENYDKAMVDAFSANLLEKFQNQASMNLTEYIVKASSKAKAAQAMKTHKLSWPSNQTIKAYFSAYTHDPMRDLLKGEIIRSPEQLQPLFDNANKTENDEDPLSLLIRGSCLSLMGDMENAQKFFDKILTLECSSRIKANALLKKSALVLSEPSNNSVSVEKDLEQALKLLEQAHELDPENPDILLQQAQAMTLSEKFDEAIATLNKAIELKKDFYSAMAQKFYIEFKLATRDNSPSSSKIQELLSTYKSSVAREEPDALDLHHMYVQVLNELSRFEEADQVLINLSKLDPTDGSVYVSRALLQFHLKSDPDEIVSLLNEALRVDPKIMFAYEVLGSMETQRGRTDEGIKIFATALQHAQSEAEYARCFSLLDSAKCQKAATELLELPM